MWCKTKQREGSRPVQPEFFGSDPRVSSHAVEMKMEARPAPVFLKNRRVVQNSPEKLGLEDK